MLLVPIPWANHVWALPFLTALAPSERANAVAGRRHKTPTDWARQLLRVVRRWYPQRAIVVVADSGYAALSLPAACVALPMPVTMITRLRLDAARYAPVPLRQPKQNGRQRVKGERLPTLAACATDPTTYWQSVTVAHWYGQGKRTVELASHTALWYHTGVPPVPIRWVLTRDSHEGFTTQALLCTDLTVAPEPIMAWFVLRWQMEVTPEEVRRHLGVETQRQWTALAIGRTTPAQGRPAHDKFSSAHRVSVFLGYINLHHDEVQAPFALLLLSTFLFGFSRPKDTWRWALIIGLGIPLSALLSLKIGVSYPCRAGHPYSCTAFTLRSAFGTLLLLVPALVSTSLGVWVRTRIRRRVNTQGLRS